MNQLLCVSNFVPMFQAQGHSFVECFGWEFRQKLRVPGQRPAQLLEMGTCRFSLLEPADD